MSRWRCIYISIDQRFVFSFYVYLRVPPDTNTERERGLDVCIVVISWEVVPKRQELMGLLD